MLQGEKIELMNQPQEKRTDYKIQPFFSIWLHPKKTAQFILEHKNWTYTIGFILLGGIAKGISELEDTKLYPSFQTWLLLLACIITGPFIGAVSVAIGTAVTWIVGKIFGGKGSFEDIWKVTSVSSIPSIAITPFLIVWMANSPQTFFDTNYESSTIILNIAAFASLLISTIVSVWSLVINIAGIAVAHRFSNWKAFFTIFIPTFLLIVVIGILGLLLYSPFSGISI